MKHYMLSVITPTDGTQPSPEVLGRMTEDLNRLHEEMKEAGSWVFAGGLNAPSTATVVRVRDGEALLTDGPYAEGKEYVGGFSIIKVADLDDALAWGRKVAGIIGLPIEVRPFSGVFEN